MEELTSYTLRRSRPRRSRHTTLTITRNLRPDHKLGARAPARARDVASHGRVHGRHGGGARAAAPGDGDGGQAHGADAGGADGGGGCDGWAGLGLGSVMS